MKITFKTIMAFISSFIIIFCGLFYIYKSSKEEENKIVINRSEYYIITDSNNKDILKIEKKVFDVSNVSYIKIKKIGEDREYRIDDKKLLGDIISFLNFEKFTYSPNSIVENEQWFVEIGYNGMSSILTFSNSSKFVKFNYNSKDFIIEVDDGFYNFMYGIFEKLES